MLTPVSDSAPIMSQERQLVRSPLDSKTRAGPIGLNPIAPLLGGEPAKGI